MNILTPTSSYNQDSAVTIGVFDGVHAGHQKLLTSLSEQVAVHDCSRVVVTFDVHPLSVVSPEHAPRMLTSLDRKLELLEATGNVDAVLVIPFTIERSHQNAVDFIEEILAQQLHARLVMVGENFAFGYKRQGNIELLAQQGSTHNYEVVPVPLLSNEADAAYSSTLVRQYISVGDVVRAKEVLTRPHSISGKVVHGDHEGTGLGYPTANTDVEESIAVPSDGVYAGRVQLSNGETYRSAISIGVRPMFHEDNIRVIEPHLLDFDGDIYGQDVTIEFESRLRDQMVLDGVDELVAQIEKDVHTVRSTVAL